ncbi:MAG TPA: hypothetical protein VND96_17705 [Candidatus Micrarchaeaceae archaeon]|nr:hypothetical protein [Candidatus Micrarchaeaceae archaeon]
MATGTLSLARARHSLAAVELHALAGQSRTPDPISVELAEPWHLEAALQA